ncbi:uncharacterized mitochondrial protein-like protein [Tanacetum coccineum]
MMHKKFQMSSIGELIFFLGLQVKQKEDGIFISQDKYMTEISKKFSFFDVKTASTPMETQKPLLKDEDGEEVDVHMYRSMIGSLMYLTSIRPDIMFVVCACARYQVNLKVSHLYAVEIIFSDYARAILDIKSTTGGFQFLGCRLISWLCKKQIIAANSTTKAEYVAASSCYSNEKKVIQMIKIHTDKNIVDLFTKAFNNEKAAKDEIGDRLKLEELMALYTNLQNRVLDLEHTKTTQTLEIESLKRRVKKLKKNQSEVQSKNGGTIHDIDADEDITLDNTHFNTNPDMFGVHDIDGDKVFVEIEEPVVNAATTISIIPVSAAKYLSDVDITLAQALAELKIIDPWLLKGLTLKMKKERSSSSFVKQEAIRLQAQFDKEDMIAREKEEVNAALIGQWNDIQDKVETDYELAKRLQAEEQEELTFQEKAKLFQQLLEKRRKYFAVKKGR